MKWYPFLVGVGLCAVLCADDGATNASAASPSEGGPKIEFSETRHDFGSVDPQPLKWTFTFKNTGDKTLEIRDVKPGCGCTVIPGYDKSVEPGKEGKITAELNATTMKGRIEKGINVTSNDSKNPTVHLTIAAEIKVDLAVLPQPAVWFNRIQTSTETNHTLEIKSALSDPLVIEGIDASVPWLTAKIGESTTNSARVIVATRPPIPSGLQRATVTVHTKYEKYRNVVINVTSQIVPVISALPSRLVFLKSQEDKPADVSLLVIRNDGKEFHIKQIESDSAQIVSTMTTNKPGQSYRVNITYSPKQGHQPTSGKLVIDTDEPTLSKLEIPYFFR